MLNSLQALQRSGNDQTLEQVMSEMFRVVSPPTVDATPLSQRCRKCAVVGNSGNLQQSKNGKLIDSHDFVIRYVCIHTQTNKHIHKHTSHLPPLLPPPSSGWTRQWLEDLRQTSGIGRHIILCTLRAQWTLIMVSALSCCRSNWETWSGWPARCPPAPSKCTKQPHKYTLKLSKYQEKCL